MEAEKLDVQTTGVRTFRALVLPDQPWRLHHIGAYAPDQIVGFALTDIDDVEPCCVRTPKGGY
jgi:hypothetical protein